MGKGEKNKMAVKDSNGEVNKNVIWELKRNATQMVYHPSKYLRYFPAWIHWFDLRNALYLICALQFFLRHPLTMHLILWIKLHLHIQRLGLQATEAFTVCRKAKVLHVTGQFLAWPMFISKYFAFMASQAEFRRKKIRCWRCSSWGPDGPTFFLFWQQWEIS